MKYRLELDALNAIVERLDSILEKLDQSTETTLTETAVRPIEDKPKRTYTRRNKNAV